MPDNDPTNLPGRPKDAPSEEEPYDLILPWEEDEEESDLPPARRSIRAYLLVGLALVLVAASVGLGLYLTLPAPRQPAAPTRPDPAAVAPAPAVPAAANASEPQPASEQARQPLYEEALGTPMEEDVKRVDYALIRNMVRLDMGPDQIHVRGMETRRHKEFEYTFQNIEVDLSGTPEKFLTGLLESLVEWAPDASLAQVNATVWELSVHYVPTHILHLKGPVFDLGTREPSAPPGGPRLAIVIDDLGESTADARQLAELDYPVAFSIWPRATRTEAVAEIAHQAGLDVLIHQPMEPMGYPDVSPGPGAVYVSMNASDVRRVVAENIALVPHAKGMNNHMGSRFTQDRDGVDAVLKELRGNGLFVLDSLTHPRSRVIRLARDMGLPWVRRDVFLDVVRDKEAILRQLDKAARVARQRGSAVAIGHPHPETLAALKAWQSRRDKEVAVVAVSSLEEPQAPTQAANATNY